MRVVGEALIDIVTRDDRTDEHVGGSPCNVAIGVARLGHDVTFLGSWGDDERGRLLEQALRRAGVHIQAGCRGARPTSVARARVDGSGHAEYDFELTNAYPPLRPAAGHLHVGSIGAFLEPGAADVAELVRASRPASTISYDPNARPDLMGGVEGARPRIEALIAGSDVVKASDEDLEWLYPGEPTESCLARILALGATLAVVTHAEGAVARLAADPEPIRVRARPVQVADTVGAGDSFMAGLLSGLCDAGLLGDADARARLRAATRDDVAPALERGCACAGITVGHAGSYAPTRAEVQEPV